MAILNKSHRMTTQGSSLFTIRANAYGNKQGLVENK
jgi:hypothetical protein